MNAKPESANPERRVWPRRRLRPGFSVWVALAFVALLGLQVVWVLDAIARIRGIGESFDRIVAQALPAQERAHAMQIAAQNRVMLMLRMLAEPDPFERAADAEDFERQGIEFGRERDALAELELDDQARGFLDEVRTSAVGLSRPQREIVQALVGGDDAAARALIDGGRVFELQRKLLDRLVVLTRYQRALALQAQRRTQAQQAHASTVMLMLGGGLFVLGLLLGAVVTRAIARAETVLRDKGQRAEQAAHTDALTGLLNRRGFERERRRWRAAARRGERHALLLLDLDRFKAVNDSAGHEAGDVLLQRLAQLLREQTRPQDLVARLGGDEFGVLLHGLDTEQGSAIAERIRSTVAGFAFDWHGRLFTVGASLGVCELAADAADADWSTAMKRADEACYAAKHGGRDRVVRADELPPPPEGV